MADRIPVKAKYAPGSPVDVIALQEFEPTDTLPLSLISGFPAGVTTELGNNSIGSLGDVDTSGSPSPSNGEVLAWNSTSGMWEPTLSPGSSFAVWGNISGTLSDQTDLQAALNLKADQSSLDTHTGDATIHFTEASISHLNIQDVGTNTHAQVDTHIADTSIHYTQSAISITESQISDLQSYLLDITGELIDDLSNVVTTLPINLDVLQYDGTNWINVPGSSVGVTDHTLLTNIGTNTHAQIDTAITASTNHIADATIHFTQASISITESQISDLGSYEPANANIQSHISSTANPHSTTVSNLDDTVITTPANTEILTFNGTNWVNLPAPAGVTDHTLLTNIGTNTHAQIDIAITDSTNHIADATIHFTEASIIHQNISGAGTNTHAQIDTHIADNTIHYTDAPNDAQDYVRNNNTWVVATTATFGEYIGPFDASAGSFPTTSNQGDWFNVTVAGTVDGQVFIVGDILIALVNSPSTGTFAGNWTIVPNVSITDHTMLTNIGSNTHAQIDTHIADNTIHYTQSAISITESQISDLQSYLLDITGESLSDLFDVDALTPSDGDTLTWNNTTSKWEPSAGGSTDELVKVSATDTTAGYLSTELVAGNNIVLTVLNPGADEKLEIKYDRGGMPYIATISGNDMVVFDDTTRSNKTLSSESEVLYFAESAVGNSDWMQIQHATDADAGYVMPFNGTIVSVVMHCENTNGVAKAIEYYFDSISQGAIASFVGNLNEEVIDTTLNVDFTAGTKIRLRGGTGGTIQDTNIQVRVKWRL